MSNRNYAAGASEFSLSGILLIIFVVLKLAGLITWSWVWVLSPLWISMALYTVLIVIMAIWWKIGRG